MTAASAPGQHHQGWRRVAAGRAELIAAVDGWGSLGPLAENFPDVPAARWGLYRDTYPDLFGPEVTWRLPFGACVVRCAGRTVLIDTGVGPDDDEMQLEGAAALLDVLRDAGVRPRTVDIVFLTHLHADHLGWTVVEGSPAFPSARYVTHADGLAWAFGASRRELPATRRSLRPLLDAGVLELVQAPNVQLSPGVFALRAPGHAPGHMIVRVGAGGAAAIVAGDVAVHPAQLANPGWRYVGDVESQVAVLTRATLVPEWARTGVLVACSHWPGGIGRVLRDVGGFTWAVEE